MGKLRPSKAMFSGWGRSVSFPHHARDAYQDVVQEPRFLVPPRPVEVTSLTLLRSMPLYELTHESLTQIPRATMQGQSFRERDDLQRLLKGSISVISDDLFLIAEEFSQWEDSRRRIDLLAVDRAGNLVVIELKRSEDGGHMDLQALRYAAMISTMTFQQAVAAHAKLLGDPAVTAEAEAAILDFLGWSEPSEDFGKSVRIILVSPDFSKELTTAVLWLNDSGLDIRCVRMRPYNLQQRTLVEVDQIIPLPEAEQYTVRLKEKQEENRLTNKSSADFTHYDLTVNGKAYPNLWKRNLIRQAIAIAVDAGVTLSQLESILPYRRLIVVDGTLSGEAFLAAAEAKKTSDGYVFNRGRYFMDDDQLLHLEGKTCALSTQWGIGNLPIVDKIAALLPPDVKMSYTKTPEP